MHTNMFHLLYTELTCKLDISIYGPTCVKQELNTFEKNYPGRVANQYDIERHFGTAYRKGASIQNAHQEFKKPGI